MSEEQFLRSSERTWERLSQVAVKGAEHNSLERKPHPKCLEGTRVDLLNLIHGLLDDRKKNQLIWLHGTAGVGKSAVAFTVAERMRGLKMTEETKVEKRLAGTFFFSRKHTKRCTTGYFFATLAYQLANHFPSIRQDVNRAIHNNPALLDPDASLRDQMEALFVQPLTKLRLRLRGCPPLTFVVDALDECTSEPELINLILALAQALRDPNLPVTHILLTSRSESHISQVFQNEEVRPLVREIPVEIFADSDVDNDICTFLRHSFKELESRHTDFPQPSEADLTKLASRAGRRFIVASTMMKFIIDDEAKDPRDQLQLMLELTSELLPGTDVYKLYDRILSTCTDPRRAYMHLSIVAALADPLPLSQISTLLGPGEGRDVEATLIQLRSVMDIPTESTLPVNIYHLSIRDYVSDPSNCSLPQVREHNMPSPHSLLACSSFHLMMRNIPETTALLDALSELKKQNKVMQPEDPRRLQDSLSFLIRPLDPMSVLICMLWLRGDRTSGLQSWLGTLDGRAWLQTQGGVEWLLQTQEGEDWQQTGSGQDWLQTQERDWVQIPGQQASAQTHGERAFLQTPRGRDLLQTTRGQAWLQGTCGKDWLQTQAGRNWLQTQGWQTWLQTQGGKDWLQTQAGRNWLQTPGVQNWLQTLAGREWLQAMCGKDWLQTQGGIQWLQTQGGQDWLQTQGGQDWLWIQGGQDWLQTQGGQDWLWTQGGRHWLQTTCGKVWLHTPRGRNWLQTQGGRDWLLTDGGREWLQTPTGQAWLETPHGQVWESSPAASVWVTMREFSRMVKAISEYDIGPELPSLPAFEVIQQLKSLPDFLMLPMFLALSPQSDSISASPSLDGLSSPDKDIVHAMNAFLIFANEARERSRSASVALKYACQNWAMHMSRAPNSRDDMLNRLFHTFLNHHLLSWLEMQWCLNGLQSCLDMVSKSQKFTKLGFS